jgi:hypothetical protein
MNTKRTGELPMFARVVLVGLVAALGVTLPSRLECERWMSSAQNWACRVLADWDTWRPRESDAYCLPPDSQLTVRGPSRLARVEGIAAERSDSSERQRNARVTVSAADERETPNQRTEQRSAAWAPVVLSDHVELAMIVELCRIAEQTQMEHPTAVLQPGSLPVSQSNAGDASVQSSPLQILPNQVFAPEQPRNDIEIANAPALPADVFAPQPPRIDVEQPVVIVHNLPAQVFAPWEPATEVRTTSVQLLPDDVFAPASQNADDPVSPINAPQLVVEKVATALQPAAPGVEPVEEIGPVDPDLDGFCAIAERQIPDAGQIASDFFDAATNSSQPEFTPLGLGPELDQGIEYDPDDAGEGNEFVPDDVAMKSTHVDPSGITDAGPAATMTATAGSSTETTSSERANPLVRRNEGGSSRPPELDQAFSLTRDAMRAWMRVLAGSGQLKVTTR